MKSHFSLSFHLLLFKKRSIHARFVFRAAKIDEGKWKKGDAKRNFAYSMFGWLYGLLLLIVDELDRVKMFFVVFFITRKFMSAKSVQIGFEAYRHLGPKT